MAHGIQVAMCTWYAEVSRSSHAERNVYEASAEDMPGRIARAGRHQRRHAAAGAGRERACSSQRSQQRWQQRPERRSPASEVARIAKRSV